MAGVALTSLCVNDADPPDMQAYWAGEGKPFVICSIGSVSLYIETGQLERLIGLLGSVQIQRPDDGKRPCSFCRGVHGPEIRHACE